MIVNFDHGFSCCLCNVKRNWREYTKEELKKNKKEKQTTPLLKKPGIIYKTLRRKLQTTQIPSKTGVALKGVIS